MAGSTTRGRALALPGDPEKTEPVVVLFVKPTGVLLRGGGKNYWLGYPERLGKKPDADANDPSQADPAMLDPAGQAAMFQRLLNSPLGALGKSLIGNAVPTGPSAGRRRGVAGEDRAGRRPTRPGEPRDARAATPDDDVTAHSTPRTRASPMASSYDDDRDPAADPRPAGAAQLVQAQAVRGDRGAAAARRRPARCPK